MDLDSGIRKCTCVFPVQPERRIALTLTFRKLLDLFRRRKSRSKAVCGSLRAVGACGRVGCGGASNGKRAATNPYIIDVRCAGCGAGCGGAAGRDAHVYEEIPAQEPGKPEGGAANTTSQMEPGNENPALETSSASALCDDGAASPTQANKTDTKELPERNSPNTKKPKHSNVKGSAHQNNANERDQSDTDKRISAKLKQYSVHPLTDGTDTREEICLEVQSFLPDKRQESEYKK